MGTKKPKKQLFAFSVSIEVFLNINEKVLVNWKDADSNFYGFNDVTSELTNIPTDAACGKRDEEVLIATPEQIKLLHKNDRKVMLAQTTKIFIEEARLKNSETSNWLTIKTPLHDNIGRMLGVFDLSFSLGELNLQNIFKIIEANTKLDNLSSLMMQYKGDDITKLTNRQHECLYYLARGRAIKEIAKILSISPRTVENHLEQVKLKLKCHTKSQLISKVWDQGYL